MLTIDEKLKLLTAKNGWQTEDFDGKIGSVFVADGPHGLRKVENNGEWYGDIHKNTAYPSLALLSYTWNTELAYLMGSSIADDCIENNVDLLLAPGVNIKRTPLCGRNFEYFSEDPYLAGEFGYAYISGVQSKGIGTSLKHFACNNSENYRHWENSEMDDRTLFEIYLPAFRRAVEAKPWTVMCSYNIVNGLYASENKRLLKDILRDKFGFDGVIISDWESVRERAKSLKATLDLEFPHNENSYNDLKMALECSYITEAEVDDSVNRILDMVSKSEKAKEYRKVSYSKEERHNNARKIAQEGIVLLKNEDNILPLKTGTTVEVYQDWLQGRATERIGGLGSSAVVSDVEIKTLAEALEEIGFDVKTPILQQGDSCSAYKIVTIAANEHETEGNDRKDIRLREKEEETILRLVNAGEKVIVVIYAGSAVDVSRFIDKVAAIIFAGFGGEAVNEAVADILSGKVCPSGKLTETFPVHCFEDVNAKQREYCLSNFYRERFYFGYRYYDKYNEKPQFPFGYGLSYAKFEYSDIQIKKLGETDFQVEYVIKNVSNIAGKEVSQVYVRDNSCLSDRPFKELKGFSKDLILPGESKRIFINLDKRAFEFYNSSLGDYCIENGKFTIYVGSSANDIRLQEEVEIKLPKYVQYSKVYPRD